MVVLSRILPYRANRWRTIIVGLFQTAVAATSLLGNTFPDLFAIFFVAIEVACTCSLSGTRGHGVALLPPGSQAPDLRASAH
jgi:hypothetical protein